MRNLNRILAGLFALVALNACKSNDELVYLKNFPQGESIQSEPFSTDSYHLRPGDNLYVQVSSINPEVNQLFNPGMGSGSSSGTTQQYGSVSAMYLNGYLLNQQGLIELPIVGEVKVEDLTLDEAKKLLKTKVAEYIKDASISVKLLNFKVTVMGEVSKPGVYYCYNNTYTLLEAISEAGGTTDYSRLKKALIVRETAKGKTSIPVDLTNKELLSSEAYYLHPNDVIYVWPDRYKNTKLNASMYSLLLSTVSTLIVVLKFMSE